MRLLFTTLFAIWMALTATAAQAHKPSDSYLTLTARDAGLVQIEWHIALRDLDSELHLDANDDSRLNWGEVRTRWAEISQYASGYLTLSHAQQACTMQAPRGPDATPRLATHTDGQYAVLSWAYICPLKPGEPWRHVDVDYRLFALTDPTHRGIVHWRRAGGASASPSGVVEGGTVVLGIPRPHHTEPLSAEPEAESIWHQLGRFIQDGVHHIAVGTDHILFLMSLLLVSVWQRTGDDEWQARPTWQASWREVLKLVTAFTVAHSITLGLASFGVLSPPSRWVESLIALSVLVAAMDNLLPIIPGPRWVIVFAFGLVHGFGFASALQDMALTGSNLAVPLLGFNLGVEAGQLSLVAVVLPAACLLRRTRFYRLVCVGLGSALIAAMALVWLIERMANVTVLGWGG